MDKINETIKKMQEAVPNVSKGECTALINNLGVMLFNLKGPIPIDVNKTGKKLKAILTGLND